MSAGAALANAEFTARVEPYRRELTVHCYRMLGSLEDAEDLVQETYLRAWRSFDRFEGRSSVRAWLYAIATNLALTALRRRGPRMLPSGLGAPSHDPQAAPVLAAEEVAWLDPIPDALIASAEDDPAAVTVTRAGLRLALIAALQHLPGRQRAVLILREALAIPAAEVAELLQISTPAVKSALQRARRRLEEVSPAAEQLAEPSSARARELLDVYMRAFEQADPRALERALCDDAVLEMTPDRTWFKGKLTCVAFVRRFMEDPREWRMLATVANGQPAALAYRRDAHGVHRPFAVVVLTVRQTGIARISLFGDPGLFPRFGAPERLSAA